MSSSIPVFVFPNCVHFGPHERTNRVSLYNPYDFALKFTILSTTPDLFALSASSGVVREHHMLDIVVRLRDHCVANESKFLVSVREVRGQRSGERVVPVVSGQQEQDTPSDRFAPIVGPSSDASPLQTRHFGGGGGGAAEGMGASNHVMAYVLAVTCLLVLLLPHESNHWLSVGFGHKLVVAYVLGLLTVVLVRH